MSGRFRIKPLPLAGLNLIERLPITDQRGFLERLFCMEAFTELGVPGSLAQINHTLTRKRGTVRGMHFQHPPHAEIKVVSCLRGEVFDVAIDLRAGSPTFLKWHGEVLTAGNFKTLYIPQGFAHGFQTLTDDCEMLYFHTAPYVPNAEGGISPIEPRVGINWPLGLEEISPRDAGHAKLSPEYSGVLL